MGGWVCGGVGGGCVEGGVSCQRADADVLDAVRMRMRHLTGSPWNGDCGRLRLPYLV